MRKKHHISLVLFGVSCFLYYLMAYHLPRTEAFELLLAESALFFIYFYWIKSLNTVNPLEEASNWTPTSFKLYGLVFRLIFIFSIPQLSDDVYRFIWDGQLLVNGINPFRYLPSELQGTAFFETNKALFTKLNSPNYFSVYPPLNQFFFWISAFFSFGNDWLNIVFLRVIILLAEFGVLCLPAPSPKESGTSFLSIYWLNPLVIIELTGNLHFEAVVIFFLLLTYHFLKTQKNHWAAITFSAAVLTKLLPLIFLPLIFSYLKTKKGLFFTLTTFLICIGVGSIFFDLPLLLHLLASVKLYFNNFEFNASIYYLLREVGYWVVGYNIIEITGKLLSAISFIVILYLSFSSSIFEKKQTIIQRVSLILSSYLFLATTIHPWYLTPLVCIAALGGYRFVLIWSALIPLTYLSYQTIPYQENLWIVLLEYLITIGFFLNEKLSIINFSNKKGKKEAFLFKKYKNL